MEFNYKTKRQFVNDLMIVMFVAGTIGIALKFVSIFEYWVFFPWFPNILDATFLIISVVYLAWRAKKR